MSRLKLCFVFWWISCVVPVNVCNRICSMFKFEFARQYSPSRYNECRGWGTVRRFTSNKIERRILKLILEAWEIRNGPVRYSCWKLVPMDDNKARQIPCLQNDHDRHDTGLQIQDLHLILDSHAYTYRCFAFNSFSGLSVRMLWWAFQGNLSTRKRWNPDLYLSTATEIAQKMHK